MQNKIINKNEGLQNISISEIKTQTMTGNEMMNVDENIRVLSMIIL